MERAVECTHCGVVMTSWSVPASPVRYYQCPFCQRTHSSHYGEVFRSRAGARVLDVEPRAALPSEIPMARPEDVRWASIKSAASRWYARLEADELRNASSPRPSAQVRRPIPLTVAFEEPRRRDPLGDLRIDVEPEARRPIPLTVAHEVPRRRDPLGDLQIDVELEAEAIEAAPEPIPVAVGAGKRR